MKLPFDVSVKGTLDYNTKDHFKMAEFRKKLKKALNDCLSFPDRPDSHVLETISGRGTLFEIFHRDEAIHRLDAVISECDRNLKLLKRATDTAQRNIEKPIKRKFITARLRTIAIELLITNRYVDEEPTFFKLAEDCWNWNEAINDQMRIWKSSPIPTEKWLLNGNTKAVKRIEEFKSKVEVARDKLSKLF